MARTKKTTEIKTEEKTIQSKVTPKLDGNICIKFTKYYIGTLGIYPNGTIVSMKESEAMNFINTGVAERC